MTSFLIDINVRMAITIKKHPQHINALGWYDSVEEAALLFCRFTMPGFLRLLTNRQVVGDSTYTLGEALAVFDLWNNDPRISIAAEPRGAEMFFRLAVAPFESQPATKAIADCYLVGFAESAGAHLVTFDKGPAATAKFRDVPVTVISARQAPR